MAYQEVTDAWRKGYRAGYAGDMTCPYPQGTQDAKDWQVGYEEAIIDMEAGR